MDSNQQTPSRPRDNKGRYLSRQALAVEHASMTTTFEMEAEMGVIIDTPPASSYAHLVKEMEIIQLMNPPRQPETAPMVLHRLISRVVLGAALLAIAVYFTTTPPAKGEEMDSELLFFATCRIHSAGLLSTFEYGQHHELKGRAIQQIHEETFRRAVAGDQTVLQITESEQVTAACERMWADMLMVTIPVGTKKTN